MLSLVWMFATFASAPQAESVQRSVSASNGALLHCFALQKVDLGHAELRFRVSPDRRAMDVRITGQEPAARELAECLEHVIARVEFDSEAIGADVVYPIRYRAETSADPRVPTRADAARPTLSIKTRDSLIGDGWFVVDSTGQGVSDIGLARLASADDIAASLGTAQNELITYSVIEGLVALAAFGGAGYGFYGLSQGASDDGARNLQIGLVAGGGTLWAIAGSLFLYHVVRALDVSAVQPIWHHVGRTQADELVSQANGH